MIIEKVTGKPLRNVVSKVIFEPLKMHNTGYYGERELPERFELPVTTQGYLKRSKIVDSFVKLDSSFKVAKGNLLNTTTAGEKIDATARIVSTVEDLLKFGQALYGGKLLSEKSLKWLMSAANKLENRKIGEHRQSVTSIYKTSFGVLFSSEGNGPSGTHAILAYHPETKIFVAAFTNIFGIFDEHDFIRDQVIDKIVRKTKHAKAKNR